MSKQIAVVFLLTLIIHLTSTLSYALRIAGVRTGRIAISFALFKLLVIVSRTSNTFQVPLLAKHVEQNIITGSLRHAESDFRWLLLAARLIRETETQLSIIMFPEIHHAAHKLWHTVASEHSLDAPDEAHGAEGIENALPEILREVDCQIGRLIEAVGDEATVMVFSLHGMELARGLPAFLGPLLCSTGQARLSGWDTQSWPERALSLFAKFKRHAPSGLKKTYHRRLPQGVTHKLAQPTMIPAYDWTRTRAFALPSDQHGWIRINLVGREAKGCVPLESYRDTCFEIEEGLRSLRTEDGSPLVRDIIHTAQRAEDSLSRQIPDVIVHWHDAAFALPMRTGGLMLEAHPAAAGQTGQHAPDGFCIMKGQKDLAEEAISATELHRIIIASLTGG